MIKVYRSSSAYDDHKTHASVLFLIFPDALVWQTHSTIPQIILEKDRERERRKGECGEGGWKQREGEGGRRE